MRSRYLRNSGVDLSKIFEFGIPEPRFRFRESRMRLIASAGLIYPRRMLSKNSLLFLVALSLPSRNSVASSSSIG